MDKTVSILMRQTTYTKEECIELLKENTLEECLSKYLKIEKKEEPIKTTNQNIFKTIRDFF
jgi:hypothetical protein